MPENSEDWHRSSPAVRKTRTGHRLFRCYRPPSGCPSLPWVAIDRSVCFTLIEVLISIRTISFAALSRVPFEFLSPLESKARRSPSEQLMDVSGQDGIDDSFSC